MGKPRPQIAGSVHDMMSNMLDKVGRTHITDVHGFDKSVMAHWTDSSETNGRRLPVTLAAQVIRTEAEECGPCAPGGMVFLRYFASLVGAEVTGAAQGGSLAASVAAASRAATEMSALLIAAMDPDSPGGTDLTPRERAGIAAALGELGEAVAHAHAALARGAK